MIKPEDLKKMTPSQRAALKKAEMQARLKAQMNKPSKPTGPGKKNMAPKQVGPAGPKKKSPNVVITPKPKKKPTLDDFLLKGKRPPLAPGQKKLPNDYDVILKGYNDKKTINKYKKK